MKPVNSSETCFFRSPIFQNSLSLAKFSHFHTKFQFLPSCASTFVGCVNVKRHGRRIFSAFKKCPLLCIVKSKCKYKLPEISSPSILWLSRVQLSSTSNLTVYDKFIFFRAIFVAIVKLFMQLAPA